MRGAQYAVSTDDTGYGINFTSLDGSGEDRLRFCRTGSSSSSLQTSAWREFWASGQMTAATPIGLQTTTAW